MAQSVRIDLSPPPQDDVVALRIYESATKEGAYLEIENVTDIGTYPTYISHYVTDNATSATGWFKIAWEYMGGVLGPMSQAVQGGQGPLLIGRVVERVMQRDSTLSESVVTQEAEGVIEYYFNVDPYSPDITYTYKQLNGLVLIVLARANLMQQLESATVGGPTDSFVIGLVSAKSSTSGATTVATADAAIKRMFELGMADLGIPLSLILQVAMPATAVGLSSYDHSRLIAWFDLA